MNNLKKLDGEKIAAAYARFDQLLIEGKGALCRNEAGKEFLDFTSGIGVNSLGFCDSDWITAVCGQLQKIQHASNLYFTEPQIRLADALTKRSGMSKVFFANSGAEAAECAIKAARKYGNLRSGGKRNQIITLSGSFHGRTMAAITATGQEHYHKDFYPFVPGFRYCPTGDSLKLTSLIDDQVCAVMLELVQGEGGVLDMDQSFVRSAEAMCRKNDILLIVDEVQTGIGRTGTLFAYEQYGIEPDMVMFAKGIGGGLPLGGVLFNSKTKDILQPGDHGSTFGGNPIACAGALAVMEKLTPDFLTDVKEKGIFLKGALSEMPEIYDLSGLGLMLGFKVKGKTSAQVVADAMENGLLLLTAKDKVRLLPPLIISMEQLQQGVDIIQKVLRNS